MFKTTTYPIKIEAYPGDGGYLAYFPALPGCQTWGDTFETAVRNAEEAVTLYVETLIANGDPLPEPQSIDSEVSLGVIIRTAAAA